ncbi:LacI family DNA-binding transcriptional regulator [Streptomyces chartreusis]
MPAHRPLCGGPPKFADVARAASVSRTTISHALNGLGQVDLRTRER